VEFHVALAVLLLAALVVAVAAAFVLLKPDPLLAPAHVAEFAALVVRQREVAIGAIDYPEKRKPDDPVPRLEGDTTLRVHLWYVIRRDGDKIVQQIAVSGAAVRAAPRMVAIACAVLGLDPSRGEFHVARGAYQATFRLGAAEHDAFVARAPVTDAGLLRAASAAPIAFRDVEGS
jgi:hypothetical protein